MTAPPQSARKERAFTTAVCGKLSQSIAVARLHSARAMNVLNNATPPQLRRSSKAHPVVSRPSSSAFHLFKLQHFLPFAELNLSDITFDAFEVALNFIQRLSLSFW